MTNGTFSDSTNGGRSPCPSNDKQFLAENIIPRCWRKWSNQIFLSAYASNWAGRAV